MSHIQEHLLILCDAEDAGYQLIDDLQIQISLSIILFIDSMQCYIIFNVLLN
jgi:hypothetical protein